MDVDILVRTLAGTKKVSDIQTGDILFNESGLPVTCIAASDPFTCPTVSLKYRPFGTRGASTSIKLSSTATLRLQVSGGFVCCRYMPKTTSTLVQWLTLYDRSGLTTGCNHPQFGQLVKLLYDAFMLDCGPSMIADIQPWIHNVLGLQLQQGAFERPKAYAEFLPELRHTLKAAWPRQYDTAMDIDEPVEIDLENGSDVSDDKDHEDGELLEMLYEANSLIKDAYRELGFEYLSHWDITDNRVEVLATILSKLVQDHHASQQQDGLVERVQDRPSLNLGNSMPPRLIAPIAEIVSRLETLQCDCGGTRLFTKSFPRREDAQMLADIMDSQHFHLVDPLACRNGDKYEMNIALWNDACINQLRLLKLYRGLHPVADASLSGMSDILVPPYFLGSWLGDGCHKEPSIFTADPDEVEGYLQSIADSYNPTRPAGTRQLVVRKSMARPTGMWSKDIQAFTTQNVWRIAIVTDINQVSRKPQNPIRNGLAKYGLIRNKAKGVPDAYKMASEDTKLRVLAGLIDTDGAYISTVNQYTFTQAADHHKIVVDFKDLADRCGINTSSITQRPSHRADWQDQFSLRLSGKGINKLQPYLLIARKRITSASDRTHNDVDGRPIVEISDAGSGVCRSIQVDGGLFQLGDGLMMKGSRS